MSLSPMLTEGAVAAGIATLFVIWAVVFVKPEHLSGQSKGRVVFGALIEGVIVGALMGFVILPGWVSVAPLALRPTEDVMAPQAQAVLLPAFLVEEFVRNGGLTAAPGLSFFLRPRRRAILVRRKNALEKRLAKLDAALTGPPPETTTA